MEGETWLPHTSVHPSICYCISMAAPATNMGCKNINNHHHNSSFIFFRYENKPALFAEGSHLGKHLESALLPRRAAKGSEDTSPCAGEEEEEEGANSPGPGEGTRHVPVQCLLPGLKRARHCPSWGEGCKPPWHPDQENSPSRSLKLWVPSRSWRCPRFPPGPRRHPGLAAGKDLGDPRGQEEQGCSWSPGLWVSGEKGLQRGSTSGGTGWHHSPARGHHPFFKVLLDLLPGPPRAPGQEHPPPSNTWGASEALPATPGARRRGRVPIPSYPIPSHPWQVPRSQQDTRGQHGACEQDCSPAGPCPPGRTVPAQAVVTPGCSDICWAPTRGNPPAPGWPQTLWNRTAPCHDQAPLPHRAWGLPAPTRAPCFQPQPCTRPP